MGTKWGRLTRSTPLRSPGRVGTKMSDFTMIAICVVFTGIVMISGLVLATKWVEAHPEAVECDVECRALRDRQFHSM